MRAVVTGGAGFIGSHLVDLLLAAGDEVTVVDDLSAGRRDQLDTDVDLRVLDVRDPGLASLVGAARPDVIYHLAAQPDVRRSVADPVYDASVNVLGTVNVLQAAAAVDARVIFASSGGAIYGADAPVPTPETAPPGPLSPYGAAKLCGEEYLRTFCRLYGQAHVALRLANVYGPRQDPTGEAGVVAIFAGATVRGAPVTVFGDGRQTRDYVYVSDVAAAFQAAASAPAHGTWNVGTGVETSVLDLVEAFGAAAGRSPVVESRSARPGELPRSMLNVEAASTDLGVVAAVGLQDGVRRVVDWVAGGAAARASA